MNHFPIAFGTIVVGVIGAAVVLDHVTSTPSKTSRAEPSTLSSESKAPSSANVAVANPSEKIVTAIADDKELNSNVPSASRPRESAPINAKSPPKSLAKSSSPSTRGSAATATSPSNLSIEDSPSSASALPSTLPGVATDNPTPAAAPAANPTAGDQSSSARPQPTESAESNPTK
jgi:hypothetical protein